MQLNVDYLKVVNELIILRVSITSFLCIITLRYLVIRIAIEKDGKICNKKWYCKSVDNITVE